MACSTKVTLHQQEVTGVRIVAERDFELLKKAGNILLFGENLRPLKLRFNPLIIGSVGNGNSGF